MATTKAMIANRFPPCKFLGRLVLEGPSSARPEKSALQTMISDIERRAPSKNKRKLHFEVRALRPTVPNARYGGPLQSLVAFDDTGNEIIQVPFARIVSIGCWRRCFVFITLDEPQPQPSDFQTSRPTQSNHGKFLVQAFRFRSTAEAGMVSAEVIRAVSHSRIKTKQALARARRAQTTAEGWVTVSEPVIRKQISERMGRNPLQSPLPDEVPDRMETVDIRYEDRPIFCSPLPPKEPEMSSKSLALDRRCSVSSPVLVCDEDDEIIALQAELDSHCLSPRPVDAKRAVPASSRYSTSRDRAAKLQKQFGEAMKASPTNAKSENSAIESPARISVHVDNNRSPFTPPSIQPVDVGNGNFNLVCHDHELEIEAPKTTGSGSPAESGYSSASSSNPGSNVSLLSPKALDEGLAGDATSASPTKIVRAAIRASYGISTTLDATSLDATSSA